MIDVIDCQRINRLAAIRGISVEPCCTTHCHIPRTHPDADIFGAVEFVGDTELEDMDVDGLHTALCCATDMAVMQMARVDNSLTPVRLWAEEKLAQVVAVLRAA